MIPKQIVCIDLISPVLRNRLDSHTLDLFTTNVLPEGGALLWSQVCDLIDTVDFSAELLIDAQDVERLLVAELLVERSLVDK